MAFRAVCQINGDNKENMNIPTSSAKPDFAVSKVSPYKRKPRLPLEDITHLYYPGSVQESSFVVDTLSLFILAILVYQMKKSRFQKAGSAKSRNSAAAATLRKHFR